jgi:putative DNA primase/helicase
MTATMTVPEEARSNDLDYITTDSGNAERLVREHGRDFRYCEPLGGWLTWNGVRWQVDNTAIYKRARSIGKTILHEAADETDNHVRDRLIQHARYSLSDPGIRRMVSQAEKHSGISAGDFDRDPHLLNVWNGTLDLRTGELRDHDREDLITKLADVTYDPAAKAPTFYRFIRRVLPNGTVRRYVRKALGYSLSGGAERQEFYLNQGMGDNGKNTLYDTILTMMGDYAQALPIDALMTRQNGGSASPEIASLKGKRLVVASESDENQRLKPGLIKRLTGDKTITARQLYKGLMTFERQFKLFLHVNHKPEIGDDGHGMWRRVKLIPWTVTITQDEKDPTLPAKLEAERSGILNWMLDGYRLYLLEGLEPPEHVRQATGVYRDESSKVTQFIVDECVTGDEGVFVVKDLLYQAYKDWCGENGLYPESKKKFGNKLVEKGYDKDQQERVNGKKVRVWRGLGLAA